LFFSNIAKGTAAAVSTALAENAAAPAEAAYIKTRSLGM
jgi:hypothetical protein